MAAETEKKARGVAEKLERRGHGEHANRLYAALHGRYGSALLLAIREACQTILTAIEAIDPVSATLIEELRLDVDKRIGVGAGRH
jgi:hypothetical protein